MKNISIFCLTLNPKHEKLIRNLNYLPVGLGDKKFSENCFSDKKTSISKNFLMESIHFIIGFGKIILIRLIRNG